jgi:glycosyltransferase involved in cell wall biosynthesis
LGLAQVALVTLREGFEGLVMPSKVFGYMARGLPTIYVGPPSDLETILTESGGGKCFRNGAVEELADFIESLVSDPEQLVAMGRAASAYYEAHFSRAAGLARYSSILGAIAARRPGVATPRRLE